MVQLAHSDRAPDIRTDRLIQLADVIRLIGLARSSIYKMMGEGRFPKPVRLGSRSVRWVEREVHEWIENLQHQRDDVG